MRKKLLLSILSCLLPVGASMAAPDVKVNYKFSESTLLADGKWVRVSVPETGLYEVTYDQLRQMGFTDPRRVTVYGRGGSALAFNFQNTNGSQVYYKDNPQAVRTLHTNDKIIFYGIGPEDMTAGAVGSGESSKVSFTRDARNIYANASTYLLTDSQPLADIPVKSVSSKDGAEEKTKGFSYFYHEQDLTQSGSGTGQLFWGEKISYNEPLRLSLNAPYATTDGCYILYYLALSQNSGSKLNIKFNDYNNSDISLTSVSDQIKKFSAINNDANRFTLNESGVGRANIEFLVDANFDSSKILALDWITVSVPINLAKAVDDAAFSQQYIAFPATTSYSWKFRVPDGSMAWDITGRAAPQALEVVNGYAYNSGATLSEMIVFNPAATQKTITEWHALANQNFHALQQDGVELLIFTTEELRTYAERIAAAHRKYDGINVLVATPQEVYNEFSNGTPDPMAYRALAKMLFHHKTNPLKNVILLGGISADPRNTANIPLNGTSHISYQKYDQNITNGCVAITDYFGCVTDYFANPQDLRNMPINVGVGLLPIYTHEEAANVTGKIEDYLSKKDFSNMVNESLTIACHLDNNLHENQICNFTDVMQANAETFGSQLSNHMIRYAGHTSQEVSAQLKDALYRGKLFSIYFGHAVEYGLIDRDATSWVTSNDILSAENSEMGFFFLAACDLCDPVKSAQGLGDIAVTRAKRGFIGTVCSTSKVMSNENEDLAKAMYNAFFKDRKNVARTANPTIGEAYAQAKDAISNDSQLAYVLIGDPALRLPFTLGQVSVKVDDSDYYPGDVIKVTGSVLGSDGNVNTAYNGFATVKLMEPKRTVVLESLKPSSDKTAPAENYKADMTDFRLVTAKAEVKNGVFTASLVIPESCKHLLSTADETVNLPVFASTYNPETRLACSGIASAKMAVDGTEPEDGSSKRDTQAPVINLSYNPLMQTLTAQATDNIGLYPGIGAGSGITLTLNGKTLTLKTNEPTGTTVTNYQGVVSTAHLQNGTYKVTAVATDLAGNSSEPVNFNFTVSDVAKIKLTATHDVVIDEIKFKISGNVADEPLALVILDANGKNVYSDETSANEFTADLSDLAPGIYRAAVRHNSAMGARLHSNWIEFTVID